MAQKLPALSRDQIAVVFERLGFEYDKRTDHRFMRHPERRRSYVKLPNKHGKSTYALDTGLFQVMLRNAGVTKKQFSDAYFASKKRK